MYYISTEEDKEMLAKYDGWQYTGMRTPVKSYTRSTYDNDTEWTDTHNMSYSTNWEWIMPVARKVIGQLKETQEKLWGEWGIEEVIIAIEMAILEFDINQTCQKVVKGINLINKIKEEDGLREK